MTLKPAPELKLLLLSAHRGGGLCVAQQLTALLASPIEWDLVVLLARRHGLAALLHQTLVKADSSLVPAIALQRLRLLSEAFRFKSLVFVKELLGIMDALARAGVVAVPYKGPMLSKYLYEDVALRQFVDLDVLVRPSDVTRARQVLIRHGLTAKDRLGERIPALWARMHGESIFRSADGQITVELAWRIAPWYWRFPEVPDEAWHRLGSISMGNASMPWMSPEDLLYVLCLHGSKHKWDTLKWIVDIAELLRLNPGLDWRYLDQRTRRDASQNMLAIGLVLAKQLLDAPLPTIALDSALSRPEVGALAADVCERLYTGNMAPASTEEELAFLVRVAQNRQMKLSCMLLGPAYRVLHRAVRPGLSKLRGAVGPK